MVTVQKKNKKKKRLFVIVSKIQLYNLQWKWNKKVKGNANISFILGNYKTNFTIL